MNYCLALLAISCFVCDQPSSDNGDATVKFRLTPRKSDDAVQVQGDKGRAVLTIKSPTGISQVGIERIEDKWPDAMMLRLQLKGLERLRLSNGKIALAAAVSSHSNKPKTRLWKDGAENSPLDSKSPLWMEIRMFDGNGKPTKAIPLNGGHFEMQVPRTFFADNPKSITVEWIDFYRN